jgi:acyl-CoA synthetase (AMP-forming)/AMP-acid ligase II
MRDLVPPTIVFQGATWTADALTALAAGWHERARQHAPSAIMIAMVMANHPESAALFFALSALPAPLILLSPEPRAWRTAPPLPAGTPLFLPPSLRRLASAAGDSGLEAVLLPDRDELSATRRPPFLTAPGVVSFTSGSTGLPKPVFRSTASLLAETTAIVKALGLSRGDGIAGSLPLANLHGLPNALVLAALLESELGLQEHFEHRSLLALFASGRYRYWAGTPLMADILSRCPLPGEPPPAPRMIKVGGSPMTVAVYRAFLARFGVPARPAYGSTEHGIITADTSPTSEVRPQSVGQPVPGAEVRIGADPQQPFPPGQIGRVWLKSSWCMDGYGFPPSLEPSPDRDGWSPTGDTGFLDEAGFLTLAGRIDDCFKTVGGYLVNPVGISVVLRGFPGITDAAVVPLAVAGETVIGALVEGDSLDLFGLRRHASDRLPAWSQPQVIGVTPQLPRSERDKIDRETCVAMLSRLIERTKR